MKLKTSFFLLFFLLVSSKNLWAVENITDRFYTGQIKDDSGLYYYNARYYDPQLGIFTSADRAQGPNRYAYVGGNPIMRNDPSGNLMADFGDGSGTGINEKYYRFSDPIMKYSPISNYLAKAVLGEYGMMETSSDRGMPVNTLDFFSALGYRATDVEKGGVYVTPEQIGLGMGMFFSAGVVSKFFSQTYSNYYTTTELVKNDFIGDNFYYLNKAGYRVYTGVLADIKIEEWFGKGGLVQGYADNFSKEIVLGGKNINLTVLAHETKHVMNSVEGRNLSGTLDELSASFYSMKAAIAYGNSLSDAFSFLNDAFYFASNAFGSTALTNYLIDRGVSSSMAGYIGNAPFLGATGGAAAWGLANLIENKYLKSK